MISIQNLNVSFDTFHLRDICLEIGRNEFFVLMGPTGAGKTVLLESLAGIIPATSGSLILNGRDITGMPPEKRGIGIVYQDYALFPHMTVRNNIVYGFRYHSQDRSLMEERLKRLAGELNIAHLLDRYPGSLSGGELQRTALARAMMIEPAVLLLDEPLSALDPGFRKDIQDLLRRLHETSDITFLMVTHDFSEALSLAERAAVINNGRIEQTGEVEHLFSKPATEFVADFVGMKNILHVSYKGTTARTGDMEIQLGRSVERPAGYIAVRPEDIVLSNEPIESSMRNCFSGSVDSIIDRGFVFEVNLRYGGNMFTSLVTKGSITSLDIQAGKKIYFSFKATAIHDF